MITELKPTNLIAVEVPEGFYKRFDSFNLNISDNIKTGEYKILGTVTKDKINFTITPYIECISINLGLWKNYNIVPNYLEYQTNSAKDSFFSLLAANGLYFENPVTVTSMTTGWSSFEEKLIKGKILILEKL